MNPHTNNREPVELLAEEFLDRRRNGERVTVEDYATAHPECADEIRDLFPTMVALEEVKPAEEKNDKPTFDCPEQLGDLRIVREIGRGGMGVVYEALQESLGRKVAVKVLPGRMLFDTRQLERFRREARTAAALQHPGIVPIYNVGEQEGLHYLVMQKIDGAGLDVLTRRVGARTKSGSLGVGSSLSLAGDETVAMGLADGLAEAMLKGNFDLAHTLGDEPSASASPDAPTTDFSASSSLSDAVRASSLGLAIADEAPFDVDALDDEYYQSVAKIGAQAAEALAYAHSQGVLHRDIKPANLLLDRTGRVWVTDFGLAKAVGQADVSRTGELLGTLRYMSPEQLRGQATARSDLYALGLTLYELVTFRSPFDAPTPSEVLHKINQHQPDRPSKLNRKLPIDLENIILRAIAADPDKRYPDGDAMADDLRRFLEHQPIASAPAKPLAAVSDWVSRNRAAALVAVLLGGTAMLATSFWPGPPEPAPPAEVQAEESPAPRDSDALGPPRGPGFRAPGDRPPPRHGRREGRFPPRDGRRGFPGDRPPPYGPESEGPPLEGPPPGPPRGGPGFDGPRPRGPLSPEGQRRRDFLRRQARERLSQDPPPEEE